MAIIKMQKVRAGKAYGLKAVLDYIQNPEKTNGGELVSAKDCLLECAYHQMLLVKRDHLQMSGRHYVHIIQSFSVDDDLTGEKSHEIGERLLESFKGFQGVVATHTDRQHIHNHIVLNSVNFETGLKWQQSKKDLQALKALSDELCKEYGLSVVEKGKGWRSYGENSANYKGTSWKKGLAVMVADAIKVSATREEFLHYLIGHGIEADFNKESILFILPDGKKCGSDKLLSYGDFSKENLDNYLKYNDATCELGFMNPEIMFEAVRLASDLLNDQGQNDLQNKYLNDIPLSALEGRALKEAIIKLKGSSRKPLNKAHEGDSYGNRSSQPYLLLSIGELLETILNEKKQKTHNQEFELRNEYDEEQDEWEL